MESTIKSISDFTPMARPLAVASPPSPPPIPVQQALAAIGEPDTTVDLAQRLYATIAMLWSEIAGADMFLPQGGSGELRGVRDAHGGVALLSAVGSQYGNESSVRRRSGDADAGAGRRHVRSRRQHVGAGDLRRRARELHRGAAPPGRAQLHHPRSRRADPAVARHRRAAAARARAWRAFCVGLAAARPGLRRATCSACSCRARSRTTRRTCACWRSTCRRSRSAATSTTSSIWEAGGCWRPSATSRARA